MYQYSTINALAEGLYTGQLTFDELSRHGNLGIGTFQNLDGEMIGFDGKFYQIKSNGQIVLVHGKQLTPFSMIVDFKKKGEPIQLTPTDSYDALKEKLSKITPSRNYIYAFRIEGTFRKLITRSVPKTESFVRLIDVTRNQQIFRREEKTKGTLVGFYLPSFMNGINVVGYHFHFLSEEKDFGGHLLDLEVLNANLYFNEIQMFHLEMPNSKDFSITDLSKSNEKEIDTIESKPVHFK